MLEYSHDPPQMEAIFFVPKKVFIKILEHGYFSAEKFLVLAPSRSQVSKIFIRNFFIKKLSTVLPKNCCIIFYYAR
jgi:hypothetical protein